MRRRHFLQLCSVGLAATLAGCARPDPQATTPPGTPPHPPLTGPVPPGGADPVASTVPAPPGSAVAVAAVPAAHPPIPPARPGPSTVFGLRPVEGTNRFALTIDDGDDRATSEAYVEWVMATGMPITFSPNGAYREIWDPLAVRLAPAVAAGQVQIGNHTYHHANLTQLPAAGVRAELERNEMWIEDTFGVTARPWWRPPYGFHDRRTDAIAADLGFTNVAMWDGSLGDSVLLTPKVLLAQAERYLQGGLVVLGHANHPTVTHLFDQLQALIDERGLQPVTLDAMFGTSRATG